MSAAALSPGTLRATADLAPAPSWTLTGRGLEATVTPLWAGVREYDDERDPTRKVREFRDPGQFTPEYLRLWERLPVVPGHPRTPDGKLVFLDAGAPPEGVPHPADPEHGVLMPHAAYQRGSTGDSIVMVDGEHGEKIPQLKLTVSGAALIARILNPGGGYRRSQVSPGFLRYTIDGPGVWRAPDGTEHPYDREQVVNPADPRVPEPLRPWLGPNNLGAGFDQRTSWTRGRGVARIGLDGFATADAELPPDPEDMPEGAGQPLTIPRLFTLTRTADESGVSGTGLVLRGVVWPAGQVTVCWCASAGPVPVAENVPQSYLSWQHFAAIHVGQHPADQSVIEFSDGQPPPPAATPDPPEQEAPVSAPIPNTPAPPQPAPVQPTPDAAPNPEALKAENDMLKKRVAELEAALAAAQSAKTSADGEVGTTKQTLATLRAQVDGLLAEVKPHREAARVAEVERCAAVASVDGEALGKATTKTKDEHGNAVELLVPTKDLPVAAMRLRLAADGEAVPEGLDEAAYLRARFDLAARAQGSAPITEPARASADGPSPAFRESVAGTAHHRVEPAKRDGSFDSLD